MEQRKQEIESLKAGWGGGSKRGGAWTVQVPPFCGIFPSTFSGFGAVCRVLETFMIEVILMEVYSTAYTVSSSKVFEFSWVKNRKALQQSIKQASPGDASLKLYTYSLGSCGLGFRV